MNTSNYPAVVQAIHNEFNLAGEKLLQESLGIIENVEKVDIHKASRLNSVGFVNNPLITKQKNIEEITKTPKQWAEIVMKYKNEFPLHKFIANHDIDYICEKYNLLHGNIAQYKGFVPEKNLTEIENFDTKGLRRFYINKIELEYQYSHSEAKLPLEKYMDERNSTFINKSIEIVKGEIEEIVGLLAGLRRVANVKITEYTELPLFEICASKKDMISKEKYSLMNKLFGTTIKHVPDPVVLFPVEHGAVIVTAWGDEASDSLVVNELNN